MKQFSAEVSFLQVFTCWFYSDQSQKPTLISKSYHCNSLLWAFLWEFGQCQLLPPTKDLETKIKNLWFGSMLSKEMPTFVLIFFIHLIPFSTLLSAPAISALNVWFLRAQINSRYKNQCFLQRICGGFLLMQVFVFLFPSQGPLPPPGHTQGLCAHGSAQPAAQNWLWQLRGEVVKN